MRAYVRNNRMAMRSDYWKSGNLSEILCAIIIAKEIRLFPVYYFAVIHCRSSVNVKKKNHIAIYWKYEGNRF